MGDGKTSPFGNGQGATMGGSAAGGNDFVRNPTGSGAKGAGNDFVRNPAGTASKEGGRDFSKEDRGSNSPKPGDLPGLNKEGAPSQMIPKVDAFPSIPGTGAGSIGNGQKPFKIGK